MGIEHFIKDKLDNARHHSRRSEVRGLDKAKADLKAYYASEQDPTDYPQIVYDSRLDALLYKNPEEAPVDKSSNK